MKEMIASACYRILAAVVGGALAFGAGADVPLPQGYTRLEWIQSDGSQYIDTLYTHQPNSRVVAISDLTSKQGQLVFGGYESTYAGTIDTGTNSLEIAGTFKPTLGAKWHNVLLKNGATLDLSEQTACRLHAG